MASSTALAARSTPAGEPAALPLYRLLRGAARFALTTLCHLKIEGLEQVPPVIEPRWIAGTDTLPRRYGSRRGAPIPTPTRGDLVGGVL